MNDLIIIKETLDSLILTLIIGDLGIVLLILFVAVMIMKNKEEDYE